MSDPTIEVPEAIVMTFPVVTVRGFPWGLRCIHCDRVIDVGQPFATHTTQFYLDGDTENHLACVYCPCDEGL